MHPPGSVGAFQYVVERLLTCELWRMNLQKYLQSHGRFLRFALGLSEK